MVMNGVSMKQVQEWLGHSTFSTTADIYAHLDYKKQTGVCWGHCEPFGRIQTPQIIMDLSFMHKAYCDETEAVFLCLMQKEKVADSFESATSGGDGGIRTHVPD